MEKWSQILTDQDQDTRASGTGNVHQRMSAGTEHEIIVKIGYGHLHSWNLVHLHSVVLCHIRDWQSHGWEQPLCERRYVDPLFLHLRMPCSLSYWQEKVNGSAAASDNDEGIDQDLL